MAIDRAVVEQGLLDAIAAHHGEFVTAASTPLAGENLYNISYACQGYGWGLEGSDVSSTQLLCIKNGIELIDTTIAQAVIPAPVSASHYAGGLMPDHYGWMAVELTEVQWGAAAMGFVQNLVRTCPCNRQFMNWAEQTTRWIEKNINRKYIGIDYVDGSNPVYQWFDYNRGRYVDSAVTRDPSAGNPGNYGFHNDKTSLGASLSGLLQGVSNQLGISVTGSNPDWSDWFPWTGGANPVNTHRSDWCDWWYRRWKDDVAKDDGSGRMVWDDNNPNLPHVVSYPGNHQWPDTAHANRDAQIMIWFYMMTELDRWVDFSQLETSSRPHGAHPTLAEIGKLAKTYVELIGNGLTDPNIRTRNYIDGTDTIYRDFLYDEGGPNESPEGMASHVFYGWNILGMFDSDAQDLTYELWKYVEPPNDPPDSGCKQRNGQNYGQLCLPAGLLFCDRRKLY